MAIALYSEMGNADEGTLPPGPEVPVLCMNWDYCCSRLTFPFFLRSENTKGLSKNDEHAPDSLCCGGMVKGSLVCFTHTL